MTTPSRSRPASSWTSSTSSCSSSSCSAVNGTDRLKEAEMSETTTSTEAAIQPFKAECSDQVLEDLRRRIDGVRWPSKELVDDRSQGVQLETMQELARYWTSDYDWGRCEERLNALPQFKTEIDGVEVHFIHVKSARE